MKRSSRLPRHSVAELEAIFLRAWDRSDRDLGFCLEAVRDVVLSGVEPRAMHHARRSAGRGAIAAAARPILERVAARNNTTVAEMLATGGTRRMTLSRLEAMWALRVSERSFAFVAIAMNRRDHTTVLKQLQRFHPTAEQARALREIAGVEQAEPKLMAVA